MQHNGQEQQESELLQRADEQPSTPASAQEGQQKAEEYLDLLQRTQADLANYRRRMSQEQAENRVVAQSEVLSSLLPVLDDLGRALVAVPPELVTHPWVQGLLLITRRLTAQLGQLGVRQIGTVGEPFDPHRHEAITTEARAGVPEGTILDVTQPGYALGERIIRPAQVSVAETPPP
jgi:molecular chaperone GrpE